MSRRLSLLVFAAAFAALAAPATAATLTSANCEWRSPARDPFVGDVPGAVDDYADIPAATRARLKARMTRFAYDDIVSIRRDAIEGNFRYEPVLRDMHFGKRRLCGNVTRQSWRTDHEERGLAYCEDGHCVVVPLVCRNVSRIVRKPAVTAMGGPGGPGTSAEPLVFDPPAAGLPPAVPEGADPTVRPLAAPPAASRLPPVTDLALTPAPLPLASLPPAADVPATGAPPALPPLLPAPGFALPPMVPPAAMPPLPPAPAVPEPATLLLWAAGLAAGAVLGGRRRAAAGKASPPASRKPPAGRGITPCATRRCTRSPPRS